MLVVSTDQGMALCVFIDGAGVIRERHHHVDQLTPLWLSLSPKSTWPEMSQIDLVGIEKEERAAADARKIQRKAAKKSRRSNKIKRRDDATA